MNCSQVTIGMKSGARLTLGRKASRASWLLQAVGDVEVGSDADIVAQVIHKVTRIAGCGKGGEPDGIGRSVGCEELPMSGSQLERRNNRAKRRKESELVFCR